MMRTLLLVSMLAACGTDDATTSAIEADYTLVPVAAVAGAHHVVGVDTDHAGGLWLAYQLPREGYGFDDLRIVHLDPAGATLAEFRYTDEDSEVSGIALDGDAIWLSYGAQLADKLRLRKVDAKTGAELATLPSEPGIEDIAVRGNLLLLSSIWREIVAVDATTGVQQWRAPVAALASAESRGIAASESGTWVVSLGEARAVLVDDTGATIAIAAFPFDPDAGTVEDGLQLALDDKALILHRANQITWYTRPH
jgi:hypothetical protein